MSADRDFWLQIRQACLMVVDAIERYVLKSSPRTKELRDIVKERNRE